MGMTRACATAIVPALTRPPPFVPSSPFFFPPTTSHFGVFACAFGFGLACSAANRRLLGER